MKTNRKRLNIELDAQVFSDAKTAIEEMGLTVTRAIVLFLKYIAAHKHLPFEL